MKKYNQDKTAKAKNPMHNTPTNGLAKAGGASIAMEIRDEDYGGRGFSCYDLEGHLWSFGSYDPWVTPVS